MKNIIPCVPGADLPELSVIVTSYNYSKYIGNSIRSILSQDFHNFEVIILDNDSTDDTREVVDEFLNDHRVSFFRHRNNICFPLNFNLALSVCRGRYLAVISADDFLLPGHFRRILDGLKNSQSSVLGYSPVILVNEEGEARENQGHPGYSKGSYDGGRDEYKDLLIFDCYVNLNSVIFDRHRIAPEDIFFDYSTWGGSDWDLFVRLGRKYPNFYFNSTPGACSRIHIGQYSTSTFYSTPESLKTHVSILKNEIYFINEKFDLKDRLAVFEHLNRRLLSYPKDVISYIRSGVEDMFGTVPEPRSSVDKAPRRMILFLVCEDSIFPDGFHISDEFDIDVDVVVIKNLNYGNDESLNGFVKNIPLNGVKVFSLPTDFNFLKSLSISCVYDFCGVLFVKNKENICIKNFPIDIFNNDEDIDIVFINGGSTSSDNSGNLFNENAQCYIRFNAVDSLFGFSVISYASEVLPYLLAKAFFRNYGISFFGKNPSLADVKNSFLFLSDDLRRSFMFRYAHVFSYEEIMSMLSECHRGASGSILYLNQTCANHPLDGFSEFYRRTVSGYSRSVCQRPFFTVILTTYKRRDLLQDSLKSLSGQIFTSFEVVLVNDCGDFVEDILDGCWFPINYIRQGRNQGPSAARNAALRLANGRYITYLDDDDIYLPDHLKLMAEAFDKHPESFVYTNAVYVQEKLENGQRIELGRSFPTDHDVFDHEKLLIQNYIPINTWAHPRAAIAEIGNFDTGLTAFEDWDMLLRLVQHYPVHRIEQVTTEVHRRDFTENNDSLLKMETNKESVASSLIRTIYARYPEEGNKRVQAGRQALLAGLSSQVQEKSWGVPEWLADRSPSPARILAVQTLLQANPDVGTLGVVVVVPDGVDPQALVSTLESLGVQHRPVDGVWLVGHDIPDEAAGSEIELLQGAEHWVRLLSERIGHDDTPDFLWVLHAGDRLLPHATLTMGEYRLRKPDPLIWYADEAVLGGDTPVNPMLKPDFNIDLLRSYPYVGRNLVISSAAIQAVGGLDNRVDELAPIDLIWRLVEQAGPSVVGHIPEVLQLSQHGLMEWVCDARTMAWAPAVTQTHFVRMGLDAQVQSSAVLGLNRIDYPLSQRPLVSIIVPTRDQLPVLRACVEGLMEHTAYADYELLLIDNGSVEPDAVAFLAGLEGMGNDRVRVLRWPGAFDFAGMNNFAVRQARGDVLLFLNNDIQFSAKTRSDWLERLLVHVLRPEVGAVGSRLDLPNDRGIEQCGQILGLENSVDAAFRGWPAGENSFGYMNRLVAQQNVSALSASCLMIRRQVFDELGGFDADSFPVYYADADLCLKATQAGYLLVVEPDTGLLHMGGATRVLTEKFGLSARPDDVQRDRLYARWLPQLARDPNYHPALGKLSPGFDLRSDASRLFDPLPGRPLPVVMASHGDWHGCGHYRVIQPFKALESELRLEGGLKLGDFHFTDVARIQPDVIVLQGAWLNEGILTQIRRYREITGAKVVLEFDDYLPNIPTRSIHRKSLPQGVIKKIRRAIEQVDWLVVSTPALAEEYADYHDDIRVALNGLYPDWWRELSSQRRVGKKMRVGWAGGSSHTGDLAEIRSVVNDLQDEVEWVFMGMKPDGVRCEFHRGTVIHQYPAALAGLNLDLAIAPLELNQFNRSKSNLRLLELGACGVPMIATDIEPYRSDLPVTLVRNRHQDWVAAIRSHLSDPEALARQGDALKAAVQQNWMLEGSFLDQWTQAWGVPGAA